MNKVILISVHSLVNYMFYFYCPPIYLHRKRAQLFIKEQNKIAIIYYTNYIFRQYNYFTRFTPASHELETLNCVAIR